MAKISAAQQRKIHVTARELGMDDDLLHECVSMLTGRESLKELSMAEAIKVIDALEGKKGYESGDRASYRQNAYIKILMKKLGWVDENGEPDKKRLDGFVRKQYGIDDSRWMTRKVACRVIEGLKALESRQEKQQAQA